jgi:hypothetical protein
MGNDLPMGSAVVDQRRIPSAGPVNREVAWLRPVRIGIYRIHGVVQGGHVDDIVGTSADVQPGDIKRLSVNRRIDRERAAQFTPSRAMSYCPVRMHGGLLGPHCARAAKIETRVAHKHRALGSSRNLLGSRRCAAARGRPGGNACSMLLPAANYKLPIPLTALVQLPELLLCSPD